MDGWTIARIRGIPIQLHWSVILAVWAICGFSFRVGACAATLLLILGHELGHAAVARACGAQVTRVQLAGFGGTCTWVDRLGRVTPFRRALIAWGGIFGQAVLYGVAIAVPHELGREFVSTWTQYNVILALLNLVPIPPLDGAEAWRIFYPR